VLEKAYDPKAVEDRIYAMWEKSGAFTASFDTPSASLRATQDDTRKEPFTVSMPPPNATGQLHLGHAVMLALEDIFIRFARMRGKEALWVPGTDHAAIATENVVIKQLKEQGLKDPRKELGREKLVAEIAKFVEQSKNTIRSQIRKMGSSCDWSRERYTFEPALNRCVNEVFKKMYGEGLIYRGHRIVNWDPKLQTTVSDDEVVYKEEKSPFYTFTYGPFEIATARPETKFGDKYVVMHPHDERYKKYKHGDTFEAEWINGKVRATIIKDEAIDPAFGTGVMTITPWHDHTDFEIAERHKLDKEQIIGFDGKLLPLAGEFAGMSIEAARPLIVEKLKSKGLLVKTDENYIHNKATSQRGGGAIEPQIKLQWFIDVNKKAVPWKTSILGIPWKKNMSLKEVMQTVVRDGSIGIIPERFEKTYFHWIDNLRDWCISRQIWWGHRVPVWYDEEGKIYLQGQQHFIFVRHGESVSNAKKLIQGQDDPLTESGIKHAEKLADELYGRPITKIISSGSRRAVQTAEIIARKFDLPFEIWNEFNAPDFGELAGQPQIPNQTPIERAMEQGIGETFNTLLERTKRGWQRLRQENASGEILVVGHRTNYVALQAVRQGKGKDEVLKGRRELENAGFGILGEILLPEATEGKILSQDPDTLDTWFSSAMWTWSTLVDPAATKDMSLSLAEILKCSPDFQKFHPTSVMETGYDILFFWVARMILMTTYATGQIPFKTVYLHGLIRTRDGRKMSKSDPSTMIDPLDMIAKYGADALRLSMIVGQSPGNDSKLYEEKIAGYRNFVNKLWNASRFVLMQCEEAKIDPKTIEKLPDSSSLSLPDRAILHALELLMEDVTEGLESYDLSNVGEKLYSFIWNYFCDWYLELSKGNANHAVLVHVLRRVLKLLHPYCPFITEELWAELKPNNAGMLMAEEWPKVKAERKDAASFEAMQVLIDVISALRSIRTENAIEVGKEIDAVLVTKEATLVLEEQAAAIRRIARVKSLTVQNEPYRGAGAASAFTKHVEIHVPLEGIIDVAKEKERLTKEKEQLAKFLGGIDAKLGNKEFVKNAPQEVVESERQKAHEARGKLQKIEEKLAVL